MESILIKIKNQLTTSLKLIAVTILISSCYYDDVVAPEIEVPIDPISYFETVEPIFDNQGCTACHPPAAGLDLSAGNSYSSILDGRVNIETPENSIIYLTALPGEGHPRTYTPQQAVIILTWIQQGALDN